MNTIDESGMAKKLKAPITDNVWLLCGDDDFLKDHYCAKLIEACVSEELKFFNYHVFNEDETPLDDIFSTADNLPVMSEKTCLLIRNYPLSALGDKQLEAFGHSLKNIPETTVMIFYYNTEELFNGKYPAPKWAEPVRLLDAVGVTVRLDHRSKNKTARLLISKAPSRGTTIGEKEAEYLIDTVGDDMQILLNEFNKVCSYSCGQPITREMIDATAVKSIDANVFDISASILSGNTDKAFAVANELLRIKTPVQAIIGPLSSAFINLYRYKAASRADRTIDELAAPFAYNDSYAYTFRKLSPYVNKISSKGLKKIIDILLEADVKTKSTAFEPSTLMSELIARLAAACGTR